MKLHALGLNEYVDALRHSDLHPGPFHAPEALPVWWQHHGRGKRFLGVVGREDGRVVAASPLMVTLGGGVIRACVHNAATELRFPTEKGQLPRFVDQLLPFCRDHTRALALDLCDVRESGPLWAALMPHRHQATFSYDCPVMDISDGWQQRLKRKRRHELRRTRHRLADLGDVRHRVYDRQRLSELHGALDRCMDLHAHRNEGAFKSGHFSDKPGRPYCHELMHALVATDRALLSCLSVDDTVVSFFLGVVDQDTFVATITAFHQGFARAAPGHVNIAYLAEDLNDRGLQHLDFSKGWFAYKSRWTRQAYALHHVVLPLRLGALGQRTMGPLLTLRDTSRQRGLTTKVRELVERWKQQKPRNALRRGTHKHALDPSRKPTKST